MDGTPREKRPRGPGAGARPPAAAHPASQLFPVSSPSPPTPRLLRHHGRHHVRQDRLRPPRRRVRCVCVGGRDCAGGRARGGGGVELQGREKKSLTLSLLLLVLSSQQQPPAAPPARPAPRPSSSGELGGGVMPVDPEAWGLGSDPAARARGGGGRGAKAKPFRAGGGGGGRERARSPLLSGPLPAPGPPPGAFPLAAAPTDARQPWPGTQAPTWARAWRGSPSLSLSRPPFGGGAGNAGAALAPPPFRWLSAPPLTPHCSPSPSTAPRSGRSPSSCPSP